MKRQLTTDTFRTPPPLTVPSNAIGTSTSITTQISNSSRVLEAKGSLEDDKENQFLVNRTTKLCIKINTKKSHKNHILSPIILPAINFRSGESPFNCSDLISVITNFLNDKQILDLLFINKFIRFTVLNGKFLQVAFTPSPLALVHQDKEKIQFSQDNNIPIKLRVNTSEDCQNLTNFINSPCNEKILKSIGSLALGDIDLTNREPIEQLLEELSKKTDSLNKLNSFSCNHIYCSLKFPEKFLSLTSFKCTSIFDRETLTLPKELNTLTSFSCVAIGENATLKLSQQLDNLSNLNIHRIMDNVDLALPKTLTAKTKLSISDIGYNVTFKLPKAQYAQLTSMFYFSNLNESLSCY